VVSYESARAVWPAVDVPPELFAEFLAARGLSRDTENASDLYLACACAHGVPRAVEAFEHTHMVCIPSFIGKLNPTEEFIKELAQIIREKIFVARPPRITEYSGKGPLGAWLRVVVVRAAIDLKRSRGEHEPAAPADLAVAEPSCELKLLRKRYQPLFKAAFEAALLELSIDERNLLRLHFVDRVSMDELGQLFKVNRSTIFRRINSCTAALNEAIRMRVGAELSLSTADFDSLARVVRTGLEVSLSGLLRERY
jgi:RNA polymerase sigma-70 factor (ECF subfamily)